MFSRLFVVFTRKEPSSLVYKWMPEDIITVLDFMRHSVENNDHYIPECTE